MFDPIEFIFVLILSSFPVVLPTTIAVYCADYTKNGVLSYTLTNTKEKALHF